VWREGKIEEWPRSRLLQLAEQAAAGLAARGIGDGRPVGCILTNTPEACAAAIGTWLAGGVVASVPIIARGVDLTAYRRQLDSILTSLKAPLLLVEARFAPFLKELSVPVVSYEELPAQERLAGAPPGDEELAFIQYSSGSTRAPRGCAIRTGAIAAQLDLLREALHLDSARDRGVMWLPLSHDMGFFGGLLNLWSAGIDGLLTPPERFLASPRSWLDDCAEFEATLTVAPAAALSVATRIARRDPPPRPIPMRACLVGGETIGWRTLVEADTALAAFGVSLDTLVPAYGLAEATLAVTLGSVGEQPKARPLPGGRAQVVSVGEPLPGVDVRVEGDDPVGEILVRSPSLAEGYFHNDEATAEVFVDGELVTGDLGFLADGELHVVGRGDDVLKVGAEKVWATEVEALLEREPGVRAGNCALVDIHLDGPQRLVLVAEPEGDANDLSAIARRLARRVLVGSGLGLHECVFVRRGSLPKTPSGKLQRYRCRVLAISNTADIIDRVVLRDP
jgi:fatty-acyl-CoA synthase